MFRVRLADRQSICMSEMMTGLYLSGDYGDHESLAAVVNSHPANASHMAQVRND